MRYRHILLEYDRAKTVANFDEIILKRMTPHDWREVAIHWEGQESVSEFLRFRGQYPHFKVKADKFAVDFVIDICEQHDPTKKKSFTLQILKWYIMGRGISYIEDISKVTKPLETYIKFKNRIRGLDLSKITFREFDDLMDEQDNTPSGAEEDRARSQAFFDNGAALLLLDDAQVRVVSPQTEEAARYFGVNTKWCTSAKSNNMFKRYAREGRLYIILFKAENVRWQVHMESGQFMDEKDEDILFDIPDKFAKYPSLMAWWDTMIRWTRDNTKKMQNVTRSGLVRYLFRPTMYDLKIAVGIFSLTRTWFFMEKKTKMVWSLNEFDDDDKAELDRYYEQLQNRAA